MNKEKISALLSDYGMVLVLLLLCVVFTLTTFKEQPAEGLGAGQNLASKIADNSEVVLIVTKTNRDAQLKEGFLDSLKDKNVKVKVVEASKPVEAKKALLFVAHRSFRQAKLLSSRLD